VAESVLSAKIQRVMDAERAGTSTVH
jgi:hypothetical protein